MRDLHEVVHHPEVSEAGVLGGAGDGGEGVAARRRRRASRTGRAAVRSRAAGVLLLAGGGGGGGQEARAGRARRVARRGARRRSPRGERRARPSAAPQLGGDDLATAPAGACAVAGADRRARGRRRRRRGRARRRGGPGPATPRAGRLEAGGVDHGREPAARAARRRSGRGRRRRPATRAGRARRCRRRRAVRPRRRLVGREPLGGPRRLARSRRPDQDDQARIGQPERAGGCTTAAAHVRPGPKRWSPTVSFMQPGQARGHGRGGDHRRPLGVGVRRHPRRGRGPVRWSAHARPAARAGAALGLFVAGAATRSRRAATSRGSSSAGCCGSAPTT